MFYSVTVPVKNELLEELARSCRRVVALPRRRAVLLLVALVGFVGLLVARFGTPVARVGAVSGVVLVVLGVVVYALIERRRWRDERYVLRAIARRVDAGAAARAERALHLTEGHGMSRGLARLHVARTLRALPEERILAHARGRALRLSVLVVFLAAATVAVVASNPFGIIEGADIVAASNGVAPVDLRWLEGVRVRARPPEYLHEQERAIAATGGAYLPRGTTITLRGTPEHAGRALALSDGHTEIAFVDEGDTGLVARWPLGDSVALRVVARFGNVVVRDDSALEVTSVSDEPPNVVLDGAPKRIALAELEAPGEIPVRYEVTDDHGLREVHLVLRSGAREERRVLSRLDGETKTDRGGHVLRARDPFLRASHVPVEVRVEAKDNDPITGPKWGASEAITVVPPAIGEAEAKRLEALANLRAASVDALAWRLEHPAPVSAAERARFIEGEANAQEMVAAAAEEAVGGVFAGLRIPRRVLAMLQGRSAKVEEASRAARRAPTAANRDALVKATERLVLVVDGALRGMARRDAASVARELGDVADDVALGATQADRPDDRARGEVRMTVGIDLLRHGGRALERLGALGHDLGEIVEAGLGRVDRARGARDLFHGELSARDLAARLHTPDPSFGARGSMRARGGGEGGGGGAPADDEDAASEAERAFDESSSELGRLSRDHQRGIDDVEQALRSGMSTAERQELADEAKRHADSVRAAARELPAVGHGSDSWTAKGASAREQAEAMAGALEGSDVAGAVQRGRQAMEALDDAKRALDRDPLAQYGSGAAASAKLGDVRRRLAAELRWAEEKLAEIDRHANERARGELGARGQDEEKMADRAGRLGAGDDGAMPDSAREALSSAERAARAAAQALRGGDAKRGLDRQHEVQRLLEQAREALGQDEQAREALGQNTGDGNDAMSTERTDIPKADAHKGPEEFRRRVLRGLAQPSGAAHEDAVRRYAEGLLR